MEGPLLASSSSSEASTDATGAAVTVLLLSAKTGEAFKHKARKKGRSWLQTNLTNEVVSGINDVYKNKPMSKITASEVAGVCNQFFTISPVVESLVDITNGWSEKRHSFVLAIDIVTPINYS